MKYFIGALIVIGLVLAGYWAGTRQKDENKKETVSPTPTSAAILETISPTPQASVGVGNRPGDQAPDFRLKDTSGKDVSLREYIGRETIQLIFTTSGRLVLKNSSGQESTLLDPGDTIHRLYNITSMPYTVTIDANGIIR
jgi:hypothetical protein